MIAGLGSFCLDIFVAFLYIFIFIDGRMPGFLWLLMTMMMMMITMMMMMMMTTTCDGVCKNKTG